MNANPITFAGLSGMGDLIVTCTSRHSRNRFVGEEIARGKTLRQILKEMVMVAEGVRTTQSALDLSLHHKIDMPITQEVFHVLFEEKDPRQAVNDLMTRAAKAEDWG
jgi:glycerol-3-phosphate dehydrogenase (NAD(P)+)